MELSHIVLANELCLLVMHFLLVLVLCCSRKIEGNNLFFSRKLSPKVVRGSTFGRELLATYTAVRYFRHLSQGQTFHIFTEHKPLLEAFQSIYAPRETRHLHYLMEFTSDKRFIKGTENMPAYAMFRGIKSFLLDSYMECKSMVEKQSNNQEY